MKSSTQRFGTVAMLFHWISALLILILLVTGFRAGFSEDVATKTAALTVHVPVAILVFVLTLARLIWWWRFDRKPPPEPGVPAWQDNAARWTHRGLYLLIFVMLGSGIAMSALSGLPAALFGSAPLPELADLPPRAVHGIGARLIAAAILLHAAAAFYHHWFLKDRTLARMLPGQH